MNVLGKTERNLIISLVETANGIKLNRDAVALSGFENTDGGPDSNAKIIVTSSDPLVYFNGKTLYYGKLNLNDEFRNMVLTVDLGPGDNEKSVAKKLSDKYGIIIAGDVCEPADVESNPDIGLNIRIKIKSTSQALKTNDVGLQVYAENWVEDPIKRTSLDGIKYPSGDMARIQGPIFTFNTVSNKPEIMAHFAVGYVITSPTSEVWDIADALSEGTDSNWTFNDAGHTLYQGRILYNGLTSKVPDTYHVNKEHENVLLISMSNYSDVGGYVTIHY